MAHSRKSITNEKLIELEKFTAKVSTLPASERAKQISAFLVKELNVSEDQIDQALSDLQDRKNYDSDEKYAFAKQWSNIFADFSEDWFQFVNQFIDDMQDGNGSTLRAIHNIREIQRTSGIDVGYWSVQNVTYILIHYLASIPLICYPDSDINFLAQRRDIAQDVIPNLTNGDRDEFNRRAQVLLEIRLHDSITEPAIFAEVDEINQHWSELHAQAKADQVTEDEYNRRVAAYWRKSFCDVPLWQVMLTPETKPLYQQMQATNKLFKQYCELLFSLDDARKAVLAPPAPYKSPRDGLVYAFGGGAIGMLASVSIAVGVGLGVGLACTALPILGLISLALLCCALGAVAGYQLKKYLDKRDQAMLSIVSIDTAFSSSSNFTQTCTSAIVAVVMGLSTCCYAGGDVDQPDVNPPITQIDDDYDADDTAEPETSSKPSTLRSGRSS